MNASRTNPTTTRGGAAGGLSAGIRHWRTLALWTTCALLIGCGGGSASPSAIPTVNATVAATATPSVAPTATPSAAPTATPSVAPTATPSAPIAQVTFNDMMLDAPDDQLAQARTFTFKSFGVGPVSVAVVKTKNAPDSTRLCYAVDGGVFNCQSGNLPSFATQATTDHSAWTVTVISAVGGTTPIVDVAMSWPTNNPVIGLTHGRLQGSVLSPGVPEELNGFNVTFQPRAAGNFSVSAKWTVILTYIDVSVADVTGLPWVNLDERQFQGGGSGVQQISYTRTVDPSKTYRFSLRDMEADNYRPDLSADISFP